MLRDFLVLCQGAVGFREYFYNSKCFQSSMSSILLQISLLPPTVLIMECICQTVLWNLQNAYFWVFAKFWESNMVRNATNLFPLHHWQKVYPRSHTFHFNGNHVCSHRWDVENLLITEKIHFICCCKNSTVMINIFAHMNILPIKY